MVCRQLGYAPGQLGYADDRVLPGAGQIWMNKVACSGEESRLVNCDRSAWGQHNCTHADDVGVRCGSRLRTTTTTTTTTAPVHRRRIATTTSTSTTSTTTSTTSTTSTGISAPEFLTCEASGSYCTATVGDRCTSGMGAHVSSAAMCEAALTSLGKPGVGVTLLNTVLKQGGCFYNTVENKLYWNARLTSSASSKVGDKDRPICRKGR